MNKVVTKSVENINREIYELKSIKFSFAGTDYSKPLYIIFGKDVKTEITAADRNGFSLLVCGLGNIVKPAGIYFISCTTRAAIQMEVVEIIKGNTNPTFGYFESGDYVYFGIKTPSYNYPLTLYNLGVYGYYSKVGSLYASEQGPEGWMEVPIKNIAVEEN